MKKTKKNKQTRKRKMLGYIRVSTEQQVNDGESIERQEARIREWALLNNYELIGIEIDVGSARKEKGAKERQGLASLIRTAQREKAGIVVTAWDRLSRSEEGLKRILKQLSNRRLFALDEKQDDHYRSYGQKRDVIRSKVRVAEGAAIAVASATRDALRNKKIKGDCLGAPGAKPNRLRRANIERIVRADTLAEKIADILQADREYPNLSNGGFAKLLNTKGLKTSRGLAFTRDNVRTCRTRAMKILREQQELASEIDPGPIPHAMIQTDDLAPCLPHNFRMPRQKPAQAEQDLIAVSEAGQDAADHPYKDVPLFGMF